MTRAPAFSATSADRSSEPLSTTRTSPWIRAVLRVWSASCTTRPTESSSLRHGSTTVTKSVTAASRGRTASGCDRDLTCRVAMEPTPRPKTDRGRETLGQTPGVGVSVALPGLVNDFCSGIGGEFSGVVGGVVIDHKDFDDPGLAPKVLDVLSCGLCVVVGGKRHYNPGL